MAKKYVFKDYIACKIILEVCIKVRHLEFMLTEKGWKLYKNAILKIW